MEGGGVKEGGPTDEKEEANSPRAGPVGMEMNKKEGHFEAGA